jgi:hypothetical protein
MGYACSAKSIKNVLASLGYHKRVARRKFNRRSYNKSLRVAWCQAHLHWGYEETWGRTSNAEKLEEYLKIC